MYNEFYGKDFFDSRDVQERIDELESELDELDEDEKKEYQDEQAELDELIEFKEEVGSGEWKYGITFVSEDYFEEYAQEMAEDIGAIDRHQHWPANCIDWEQAADELRMDYSAVELGDTTYYFR